MSKIKEDKFKFSRVKKFGYNEKPPTTPRPPAPKPALKSRIIGVTLGWDLQPHLAFSDNTYLYGDAEKILYPEYFKHGEWPTDPETGVKLPIVK